MEEINFKQVTVEDWKSVEELEKGAASVFFCPCDSEKGYKKYIKESKVYILMKNNKAIGTLSYKTENDETILINGLTVLPNYRGKGVAKNAMKKLLTELGDKNYALYVHPANTPALLIYLRLDFIITEWKDNYFGDGQPRLYLRKNSKKD